LIVRTVGLLPILYGLLEGVALVLHLLQFSTRSEVTTAGVAVAAVGYVLVGVGIILLANPITRIVYGRDR
jgi:hypothetical protein